MILFKQEHVEPIRSGRKTQTRRTGMRRWNVGARHQCRTVMLKAESCFAIVEILEVRRERVCDISEKDARAEGYDNAFDYFAAWERINKASIQMDCWVVRFKVVELPGGDDAPTLPSVA